ncbi:hypothetical protein HKCCA1058_01315 [Rhodobacterales bacterium HKCCA1058]|nr:hypothetical protein [Rhodobacterales bacterium HKCCA1058]
MTGFMSRPTGNPSTILEDLRNRLSLNLSRDAETLIASMPEDQQNAILTMAKEANRVMRFSRVSAAQAITRLYPNAGMDKRKVILALLNAEEDRPDFAAQDAVMDRAYAQWERLKPLEELLAETPSFRSTRSRTNAQTDALISRPQRPTPTPTRSDDDLTNITLALIASESSGNPRAEYVADDGSRYSGALQIGSQRLADANAALGTNYSQDDLINDQAIQNTVNDWHMRDLARQVDAFMAELGDEAANWSRNSLIAASHISGVGGMKRHVRSGGEYDPQDALGTSISDYVNRFRGSQS